MKKKLITACLDEADLKEFYRIYHTQFRSKMWF
jgi:hypothetical protein